MGHLDAVTWPRVTERTSIRPAVPDDAAAVWRIRCSPGVSDWLTRLPGTLTDWTRSFGEPDRLARTLVVELDGVVIGDLLLQVEDAYAQTEASQDAVGVTAEIGWVLDPAHQGRGLATEAVRAVLGICFEELDLHHVVAGCAAENAASWRLMERVGMRREAHTVESGLYRDRTWHDGYRYAILRREWLATDS